jgi:hypothetical protein
MLTCVSDAQEDRDIAVVDIPNVFVSIKKTLNIM